MNSPNRQVHIETKYIVKMASHIIGNEDRTLNKQFVTTVFCCCSVTKSGPILCDNCIAIFKRENKSVISWDRNSPMQCTVLHMKYSCQKNVKIVATKPLELTSSYREYKG